MKFGIILCLVLLILSWPAAGVGTPGSQTIRAITSAEAVEKAGELDGILVEFTGEAIGESMRRNNHVWINLSDGNAALGIWIHAADFPEGISFGSYRRTGDLIRVHGVFERNCPDHGGDLDIHATELTVIDKGTATGHPVHRSRLVAAFALLAVSSAIFPLWRSRERSAKAMRGPVAHGKIGMGGRMDKIERTGES